MEGIAKGGSVWRGTGTWGPMKIFPVFFESSRPSSRASPIDGKFQIGPVDRIWSPDMTARSLDRPFDPEPSRPCGAVADRHLEASRHLFASIGTVSTFGGSLSLTSKVAAGFASISLLRFAWACDSPASSKACGTSELRGAVSASSFG